MISLSKFKNCECITMENDSIKVTVVPNLGGKVASFIEKSKEFELLFQDNASFYEDLVPYDNFDKAAWGFDDAFPSVEEGIVRYNGTDVRYPDHGEIWTLPFDYVIENDTITLSCEGKVLPYKYKKTLKIEDNILLIKYKIENTATDPIPFIWTMHCLINCERDMHINFPKGTKEVEVAIPGSNYLGKPGTVHSYPVTTDSSGNPYRLDRIFDKSACKKEKYYTTTPVSEGTCSAYYPDKGVTFTTYFDKEKLPFVGFWVTEGGYKGDYNCALEPSTGYYDFIEKAEQSGTLQFLKADEPFEFEIKMDLK